MMKLTTAGPWLSVNSYISHPYISPGSTSAGMVRFNPSGNQLEVYDGNVWHAIGGNGIVNLAPVTEEILFWAQKKMQQEREFEALAKTSPAVQDCLQQFRQAQAQLEVVTALAKQE